MDYIDLNRGVIDKRIFYGVFPNTVLFNKLCEMATLDYSSVSIVGSFTLKFTSLKTAHRVCEQISRISGIPCKWNLPQSK